MRTILQLKKNANTITNFTTNYKTFSSSSSILRKMWVCIIVNFFFLNISRFSEIRRQILNLNATRHISLNQSCLPSQTDKTINLIGVVIHQPHNNKFLNYIFVSINQKPISLPILANSKQQMYIRTHLEGIQNLHA